MKKLIMGATALSLLLAASSCQQEEVVKAVSQDSISFQSYLGKHSRASETSTGTLQAAAYSSATGIPVIAYANDASTTPWKTWSLYFDSSATPPAWTYGTPVLQPSFALVYYAWHPSSTVTTLDTASTGLEALFDYTVPVVADQEDLIAAYVPASLNAAINLEFNHLLSQVNFSVQRVADIKVNITDITLSDIADTATYTFGTGWDTPSGTASYSYDLTAAPLPTAIGSGVVSLGSGSATDANALMLMPQSFGSTAAVTVSFTLQDEDDNYLVGSASVSETATFYLDKFNTTAWVSGKRYVYLIDFSNYLVDRYINFTVNVADWENASPNILTIQVAQASQASIEGAIASLTDFLTAGYDAMQITVNGILTNDIDLTIDNGNFNAGDEIVIYFRNGIQDNSPDADPAITASGWSVSKSGTTFTLVKE